MRESALKGKAINPNRPLGLTTDEHKRFIIDEKNAPTIRFIFEHYAAGESSASIVDQLNAAGLRTSKGNSFNKCSIPRIIQNEAYHGVYICKAYDVRIDGAIPAIIDDDLWKRAQKMLTLNKQHRAPHSSHADYLLSGKLFCGCSHSALREGWDNPNVFQICTLKQSSSEVRKRQEVGRGLRLCVNQNGERMDANVLGNDVHNINILTVIASESYDSFAKGLQSELAEAVANRPRKVDATLFVGKVLTDANGNEQIVDADTAAAIYFDLVQNGYVDRHGALTDKYYADHANHAVQVAEEVADCAASVIDLLDSVYSDKVMLPENARSNNVELKIDPDKLAMPEFKALWNKISPKSVYVVDFDTDELVQKSIRSLNRNLNVSKIYFKVESGEMTEIKSKDSLLDGSAFAKADQHKYDPQTKIHASQSVKYDLIGKLVAETKLTRKAIVQILVGIEKAVFDQFKDNPEEFILKAAALINDEKATAIIQHITYNILDEHYDTDIFTEPTLKGKLGMNVMKVQRHLYDHLIYDSSNERDFAADLDTNRDVAVYVKLPDGFYISTPVGKYNPDWAIAFYEGTVKHIYFVAETKGTLDSMKLNHITPVEQAKIDCARAHFKALNDENVVYDVVSDYQTLLNAVMK